MNEPMHRGTEDTRAGSTNHIVRYVLAISVALAVIGMAVVLLWGDARAPDNATGSTTISKGEVD
ncbi:hypothetical protein [Sphingobium subterraneum]|uniref:Uncharacterized protein n=1 Tax=Sphingobium subterraneum TaxID=627688 RepID=A0A841J0K2_9SPHN|nr:hypothetical protein [Sphingobium subterraneum]MBB6124150.1 hypothetical protein [Sphingobium subterraneum]